MSGEQVRLIAGRAEYEDGQACPRAGACSDRGSTAAHANGNGSLQREREGKQHRRPDERRDHHAPGPPRRDHDRAQARVRHMYGTDPPE